MNGEYNIRHTAKNYLEQNLLSILKKIKRKSPDSFLLQQIGVNFSTQAFVIQTGNNLETFWNKVISDTSAKNSAIKNLIAENNKIAVPGEKTLKGKQKYQQIDMCFLNTLENKIYYLELKCNLSFDSEKKPASEAKITRVKELLLKKFGNEHTQLEAAYLVPCISEPDAQTTAKVVNTNIKVVGTKWLIEKLGISDSLFNEKEFMLSLRSYLNQIYATMSERNFT